MFEAYNLKEKRYHLGAEAFIKFADPHTEKWQCCNQLNCVHVKVVPITKHIRKEKYITAHFSQIGSSELKCNNTNERDRHYNTKMHIISLIYEKELKFKIGELILEYNEENIKGTEKLRKNRRADILLEFEKWRIEIDSKMQTTVNDLKAQLNYDKEKIIEQITQKTRTSCRSCKNSSPDKESDLLCCWKNYKKGTQKHPDKIEATYSYESWISKADEIND